MALEKIASWVGEHDLYAMLADVAAQQNDHAALHKYAPLAQELAMKYDHKLYQAIALRAWGVAHRLSGRYPQAGAQLSEALELCEKLEGRWQIGRTLFELGELYFVQADHPSAKAHFSRALAAYEEIGAVPDAGRTREKLAAFTELP